MNLNDDHWDELYTFAKELADRHVDFEEIEKQLETKTGDPLIRTEIIQRLKKMKYAIQRKNGLNKIGFGCLFLVIGFLVTCINFHANQSFSIVMYGTSIIGLVMIFWGLYEILG
jgi:hypothetical protein